eukprot:1138052-Pelagomonas_calceolata.AAC.3
MRCWPPRLARSQGAMHGRPACAQPRSCAAPVRGTMRGNEGRLGRASVCAVSNGEEQPRSVLNQGVTWPSSLRTNEKLHSKKCCISRSRRSTAMGEAVSRIAGPTLFVPLV